MNYIKKLEVEITKKAISLNQNVEAVKAKRKSLIHKVKGYKKDIKKYCRLGKFCLANSVDIGDSLSNRYNNKELLDSYFYTDFINKDVGFINNSWGLVGFGLHLGSIYDSNNLTFNTRGRLLKPIPNNAVLEEFLNKIDAFETRFTKYILSLNKE